jgi:glycosyltransferase involved in cell wall biosynthesis
MYRDKKVGVVVPAYNEELHIGKVLDGMPDFVDAVYVVDDCSTDSTTDIVRATRELAGYGLRVGRQGAGEGVTPVSPSPVRP